MTAGKQRGCLSVILKSRFIFVFEQRPLISVRPLGVFAAERLTRHRQRKIFINIALVLLLLIIRVIDPKRDILDSYLGTGREQVLLLSDGQVRSGSVLSSRVMLLLLLLFLPPSAACLLLLLLLPRFTFMMALQRMRKTRTVETRSNEDQLLQLLLLFLFYLNDVGYS